MKFLWSTTDDVRHVLMKEAKFLGDLVTIGRGRTNTQCRPHANWTTKIADHTLSLSRLVNRSRDHDNAGSPDLWATHSVNHGNLNGWDHVGSDALLGGRCLRYDIRATKKERKGPLLNFVRGADTTKVLYIRLLDTN